MPKAPASFPLFYTNWFEGTDVLSDKAFRCYLRLVSHQWVNGWIPELVSQRMNLCGISLVEEWNSIWLELKPKFVAVDVHDVFGCEASEEPRKVWVSPTQHDIRQKQVPKYQRVVKRNRANGKRGGKPSRNPSGNPVGNPNGNPNETHLVKSNIVNSNSRSKKKLSRFIPPTADEVRAYCEEIGSQVDPHSFVDFYESKGWKVGKNSMKCWKAAVRNWGRSSRDSQQLSLADELKAARLRGER